MATFTKDLNKASKTNPGSLENRGCRIGSKVNVVVPALVTNVSLTPSPGQVIHHHYFFDVSSISANLTIDLPQIWNSVSSPVPDSVVEPGFEAIFEIIGTFSPFTITVRSFAGASQAILTVPDITVSFIANTNATSWAVKYIPKIAPVLVVGKRAILQGNANPLAEPVYDTSIDIDQAEIVNVNITGTNPIALNGNVGANGEVILNNGATQVWSSIPLTSIATGPADTILYSDGITNQWIPYPLNVGFFVRTSVFAIVAPGDIDPIIPSPLVVSSGQYNDGGMMNMGTGVATTPNYDGYYNVSIVVTVNNGLIGILTGYTVFLKFNGVNTIYSKSSDVLVDGEDSSSGVSFNLRIPANTQVTFRLQYVAGVGGTSLLVDYGMHLYNRIY